MEETTTSGTTQTAGTSQSAGCFYCRVAKPVMEEIWTEATRNHFRNSRIEFLKGLRTLLDNRIARLSRRQEEHTGGKHVVVE